MVCVAHITVPWAALFYKTLPFIKIHNADNIVIVNNLTGFDQNQNEYLETFIEIRNTFLLISVNNRLSVNSKNSN